MIEKTLRLPKSRRKEVVTLKELLNNKLTADLVNKIDAKNQDEIFLWYYTIVDIIKKLRHLYTYKEPDPLLDGMIKNIADDAYEFRDPRCIHDVEIYKIHIIPVIIDALFGVIYSIQPTIDQTPGEILTPHAEKAPDTKLKKELIELIKNILIDQTYSVYKHG